MVKMVFCGFTEYFTGEVYIKTFTQQHFFDPSLNFT